MKVIEAFFLLPLSLSNAVYGPNDCVNLSLSANQSCVIITKCPGINLSSFEFAFNCVDLKVGGVVRHSYGFGGFEPNEEFDTEVKCDKCTLPSAVRVPLLRKRDATAGTNLATKGDAKAEAKVALIDEGHWRDEQAMVGYGPDKCISTYKNKAGHCIIRTQCDEKAIENYNLGLVCVDEHNVPTRHLFGKNSFGATEIFDTHIACHQCLGFDDVPEPVIVNGQIATLNTAIQSLKVVLDGISKAVVNLEEEVMKITTTTTSGTTTTTSTTTTSTTLTTASDSNESVSNDSFLLYNEHQSNAGNSDGVNESDAVDMPTRMRSLASKLRAVTQVLNQANDKAVELPHIAVKKMPGSSHVQFRRHNQEDDATEDESSEAHQKQRFVRRKMKAKRGMYLVEPRRKGRRLVWVATDEQEGDNSDDEGALDAINNDEHTESEQEYDDSGPDDETREEAISEHGFPSTP